MAAPRKGEEDTLQDIPSGKFAMRSTPNRPADPEVGEMWLKILVRYIWRHRGIRLSIVGACLLLTWDVVFAGWYGTSLLLCPIWFLVSVVKNAGQRPGWRLALLRMAMPLLTLGVAIANNDLQMEIGRSNAARVIAACEQFHAANGVFPKKLSELVPEYLPSVPPAKYCLFCGTFVYTNYGSPMLVWVVLPPYGRKVYHFETQEWSYVD